MEHAKAEGRPGLASAEGLGGVGHRQPMKGPIPLFFEYWLGLRVDRNIYRDLKKKIILPILRSKIYRIDLNFLAT